MYNYLVDHAIKNVWCTPDQDNQLIFKMARLTPAAGLKNAVRVLWRTIAAPDTTSRWHIFQIGQVHPLLLGLLPKTSTWVSFDSVCNSQQMIADIYTINGVSIPRFQTYYMYTSDKDLIVAVRKNPLVPYVFETEDVYLRLYTPAFLGTAEALAQSNVHPNLIKVLGVQTTSTDDVLAFQTTFNSYLAYNSGALYGFVNGIRVDRIDLITAKAGDVLELVYDSTVYKTVSFNVSSLQTFNSTLDNKIKYLLHYAGADAGRIDFIDDIDVYVFQNLSNGRQRGLYLHKNNADAFRNVTHRDYSLVTSYVAAYAASIGNYFPDTAPVSVQSLTVTLHIRNSGYNRPLVYEDNRIFDLYKLSDANIMRAMLGVDSVVPNWFAANLEASAYCTLMRSARNDITPALVEKAYGYNAMSKILGDIPQKPTLVSGQLEVNVPYGLQKSSTAYEYDSNGRLLGWYQHSLGSIYVCVNATAAYVEFFAGTGSNSLDEYYNTKTLTIDPTLDYRVYVCSNVTGTPDNNWVDVTGDATKYTISGTTFTWTATDSTLYPMVRSSAKFLAYDFQVGFNQGVLSFDVTSISTREGTTANRIMQIPLGQIDVIMNNKTLVEGLDYYGQFPMYVVTNKEYLVNPDTNAQSFHLRMVGHCDKTLKTTPPVDVGYVVDGTLSNNFVYDIRDDKVLQIVLDGGVKARSDFSFAEDGVNINVTNPINGRPYHIREVVVPMNGLTPDGTYTLRALSQAIDKKVSDYLSVKLPQTNPPTPSAIVERYQVVSPFCARIISHLISGDLVLPAMTGEYGRMTVTKLCADYEYLLEFDPTQSALQPDPNYVLIEPHSFSTVQTLAAPAYRFMLEVLKYYTRGLVTLSPFINIS
jgi:hypothetical protein